jgi:hypothetical protein
MSGRQIGAASDFYRLRLVHYDESDAPEFEWRDDILWRRPPAQQVGEYEIWRVEAVRLDDEEAVTPVADFGDPSDGHEALAAAEEDLAQMTKGEFEERYFPAEE